MRSDQYADSLLIEAFWNRRKYQGPIIAPGPGAPDVGWGSANIGLEVAAHMVCLGENPTFTRSYFDTRAGIEVGPAGALMQNEQFSWVYGGRHLAAWSALYSEGDDHISGLAKQWLDEYFAYIVQSLRPDLRSCMPGSRSKISHYGDPQIIFGALLWFGLKEHEVAPSILFGEAPWTWSYKILRESISRHAAKFGPHSPTAVIPWWRNMSAPETSLPSKALRSKLTIIHTSTHSVGVQEINTNGNSVPIQAVIIGDDKPAIQTIPYALSTPLIADRENKVVGNLRWSGTEIFAFDSIQGYYPVVQGAPGVPGWPTEPPRRRKNKNPLEELWDWLCRII